MSLDQAKKMVGEKAATLVESGMCVGLGTGSTALFFIQALAKRCQEGLQIKAVASSEHSFALAQKAGIPLIDISSLSTVDLTVDGADEIDTQKQMIKGGGGALLREKILASMSREMVVIVDETKVVPRLGVHKIPVEIIPFGYLATFRQLQGIGFEGVLRRSPQNTPYVTDNGNYIYDIQCTPETLSPLSAHALMIEIPGVVETGLFFNLAGRVFVGHANGTISHL